MSEFSEGRRQIPAPEQLSIEDIRYREIANRLFEEHRDEILSAPDTTRMSSPSAIDKVLRKFPDEILQHYSGHGVTKGNTKEQIAAAISLIETRVMFGDAAPIRKSSYANAYTHGSFFCYLPQRKYVY